MDRFISQDEIDSCSLVISFRPLSRWIGLYQGGKPQINKSQLEFPSPLEVDRFISIILLLTAFVSVMFPSPLEVDRFISPYLVH